MQFYSIITNFENMVTHFLLSIIGFLALGGVDISSDVYAWVIVLVLPINSALNPFIYTFSMMYRQVCKTEQYFYSSKVFFVPVPLVKNNCHNTLFLFQRRNSLKNQNISLTDKSNGTQNTSFDKKC